MKTILALLLVCISAEAAPATISTISCSAGVATVTVANSLAASQGFEITGSTVSTYNINGTAITANSTTFTFNVTCNGSATGGIFNPAPQILVLSVKVVGGVLNATDLFWNTVITPVPCSGCTSLWPNVTAPQLAAIQAGTTIETQQVFNLPITTSTSSLNTIVQNQFTAFQTAYALNLVQFVGFCYNGTWAVASCN